MYRKKDEWLINKPFIFFVSIVKSLLYREVLKMVFLELPFNKYECTFVLQFNLIFSIR